MSPRPKFLHDENGIVFQVDTHGRLIDALMVELQNYSIYDQIDWIVADTITGHMRGDYVDPIYYMQVCEALLNTRFRRHGFVYHLRQPSSYIVELVLSN